MFDYQDGDLQLPSDKPVILYRSPTILSSITFLVRIIREARVAVSMTSENQSIRRTTVRVPHIWHAAYLSAMRESNRDELIGRIEYAISAIERRYSEWEADPGSPAELKAIQKCICALKRLMRQEQLGVQGGVSAAASAARLLQMFQSRDHVEGF